MVIVVLDVSIEGKSFNTKKLDFFKGKTKKSCRFHGTGQAASLYAVHLVIGAVLEFQVIADACKIAYCFAVN